MSFNLLLTVVNCGKKWFVNFNDPISMDNDNFQENNLLRLLGLTIFTDMKWNYYIQSIGRFAARKDVSLSF